ncbi:MAG: hypothetical protein QMD00_02050 [Hadesarchaea archaeon]|nr:hypothetical protein [Hadesarchaea archaeon]
MNYHYFTKIRRDLMPKCCSNCYFYEECDHPNECCPKCDFYSDGECTLSKEEPEEELEE